MRNTFQEMIVLNKFMDFLTIFLKMFKFKKLKYEIKFKKT